ncbi:MAG: glycosyl hydrolase [Anaerolineae bacterium]
MSKENITESKTEAAHIAPLIKQLKLRGIGPAVMGGRIIDIAVDPTNKSRWFVAAGSGGVWKTENAGITWDDVFKDQKSYSIGCVAIDPSNPSNIWVGTGENVSGRHVGWGDGVYKSRDGGKSWKWVGLEKSEHIGKILIDPRNGDTVYVASEGPLWSAGGERGVYKTEDGGETWEDVLTIDNDTGVTDLAFDPSNPDVIIAAAYQRRRHIWALMGGGPSSGIYKSDDAGESWRRIDTGLPKGDMGKIGLATTPANPNHVYATIEAAKDGDKEAKGFYRSTDKGESWEKRSDYISGGTGPHYYQQIYASPTTADMVYQMDVMVHLTRDGGKTFKMTEDGKSKHSDNHALWIDPDNPNHMLLGHDGGLSETYDGMQNFRHVSNLPLSQFYRLDLDNSEPFYNVAGGAQDLGTLVGPSRTTNTEGVRNGDWWVPLGADGYHVAYDPTDPNILYLEFQTGFFFRYDMESKEIIGIQPQAAADDDIVDRWNWDVPILISPHNHKRIYYPSQRLWRSDDQGDSWTAVSGDLTRNLNRYELEMMGRVHSVDDLYDNMAMSVFSSISNLTESPLVEGLLYAGTDDGLIQVTEDGGKTWRVAADLPTAPTMVFIQSVEASLHDLDTVFAAADAHKIGNYSPYLYESNDRGKSWKPINGDLPHGEILWSIQQDHVNPDLLFIGAETGIYVSLNRGENWHKLNGGVPTIAFRDIKIHRRDNDLVGATFGRGFYVLDDYTPLRDMAADALQDNGHLFPVRDAWWYVPQQVSQSKGSPTMGATAFKTPNPDFGATITYWMKDGAKTAKQTRQAAEKSEKAAGKNIDFPGWDTLSKEADEGAPVAMVVIKDSDGNTVRRLEAPAKAGLHRVSWDLRLTPPDPVILKQPDFRFPWEGDPMGPLAAPGTYSAELWLVTAGKAKSIGESQSFEVKPLPTMPGTDFNVTAAFQKETSDLVSQIAGAGKEIARATERLSYVRKGIVSAPGADLKLFGRVDKMQARLNSMTTRLSGDGAKAKLDEPAKMALGTRARMVQFMHWETRQNPTKTMQDSLAIAADEFKALKKDLTKLIDKDLAKLEADLAKAGAPWTPGRKL